MRPHFAGLAFALLLAMGLPLVALADALPPSADSEWADRFAPLTRPALAEDDRSRLDAGGVVVRDLESTDPDGIGMLLMGLVDATPDQVWEVMSDCEEQEEFIPRVRDAAVRDRDGDSHTCDLVVDLPFPLGDLRTATRHQVRRLPDGGHQRRWDLLPGDWDYVRNSGSWSVHPYQDGRRSLLVARMDLLPKSIFPHLRSCALRRPARRRRPSPPSGPGRWPLLRRRPAAEGRQRVSCALAGYAGASRRRPPMLEVHHLNNSRSQRVLWLLEELGVPYEVKPYQRDATTNLAPESLKQIHPLGKSPVIKDGDQVVIESGAILEYIVRKYGKGRLAPAESSPDGRSPSPVSCTTPRARRCCRVMLLLYSGRLGEAAAPLRPRIASEIDNHFGWLDSQLAGRDWFVGTSLTAADIQLSFPIQVAGRLYGLDKFPNLKGFLDRCHARPAYRRALERGGPYAFGS